MSHGFYRGLFRSVFFAVMLQNCLGRRNSKSPETIRKMPKNQFTFSHSIVPCKIHDTSIPCDETLRSLCKKLQKAKNKNLCEKKRIIFGELKGSREKRRKESGFSVIRTKTFVIRTSFNSNTYQFTQVRSGVVRLKLVVYWVWKFTQNWLTNG